MSQIVLKWAKLRFVNHWNDFFGRWEPANQIQLFSEFELRPLPLVHHHELDKYNSSCRDS